MFKVGSYVRCVSDKYMTFVKGGHYLVVAIVVHEQEDYRTLINKYVERIDMFMLSDFEPVAEAPTSRANDPATSKGKPKVNKYEQAVLDILKCEPHGPLNLGLTGKEIAIYTDHPLNCITPRFAPLRRKGLIKALTNPIPAFRDQVIKRDKQIVWVLA